MYRLFAAFVLLASAPTNAGASLIDDSAASTQLIQPASGTIPPSGAAPVAVLDESGRVVFMKERGDRPPRGSHSALTSPEWQYHTVAFTSAGHTAFIYIHLFNVNEGEGNGLGASLKRGTVIREPGRPPLVPEPGTALLFSSGVVLWGIYRRRQN